MPDFPNLVIEAQGPIHATGTPALRAPRYRRQFNAMQGAGTVNTAGDFKGKTEFLEDSAALATGRRSIGVVKRGRKYETAPLSKAENANIASGRRSIMARSGNQDFEAVGVSPNGMWGELGAGDETPVAAAAVKDNSMRNAAVLIGVVALLGYLGRH